MADPSIEQLLATVKSENRALADQLRQARSDLHCLGVSDQNRVLIYAAFSGAIGVVVGLGIGMSLTYPRVQKREDRSTK